jgi:hypothetical protein
LDQLVKFVSALNLGITETHVQDDQGMGIYRAKDGAKREFGSGPTPSGGILPGGADPSHRTHVRP